MPGFRSSRILESGSGRRGTLGKCWVWYIYAFGCRAPCPGLGFILLGWPWGLFCAFGINAVLGHKVESGTGGCVCFTARASIGLSCSDSGSGWGSGGGVLRRPRLGTVPAPEVRSGYLWFKLEYMILERVIYGRPA